MLDDDRVRFLEGGRSLIVGLSLPGNEPFATHGWGLQVLARGPVRMRVLMAERDAVRLPEPVGARIALTAADVASLASVQLKGRIVADEAPTEQDRRRSRSYCDALFDEIHRTDGEPLELLERMVPPSLWAWTVEVDTLFDQTPGPGAGSQLGTAR